MIPDQAHCKPSNKPRESGVFRNDKCQNHFPCGPARGRARGGAGDLGLRQQIGRRHAGQCRRPGDARQPAGLRRQCRRPRVLRHGFVRTHRAVARHARQAGAVAHQLQPVQPVHHRRPRRRARHARYNIALGARRAQTVRDYLVSRGIATNRMRTISYGKERPVAVCDDISCWSQNRRAVTVLNASS